MDVDFSKPIELYNDAGRVIAAKVSDGYAGAGSVPIEWEASLVALSVNMLARAGWRVRNA